MTILVAVLLASLAGSMHCAAMCGGFVCIYAGGGPGHGARAGHPAHAAYHLARLAAYAVLGALAGIFGAGMDGLGAIIGVSRAAAVVAGGLMVLWATTEIATALGVRVPPGAVPGAAWVRRVIGRGLSATRDASPVMRAGTIGLLTALIPCGWLYAFVASAAATGSAARGALLMATFWAGTVPLLLGVGYGAQRVFGGLTRRLPLVGAGILLVLGLLSIGGRLPVTPQNGRHTGGHNGGHTSGQTSGQTTGHDGGGILAGR